MVWCLNFFLRFTFSSSKLTTKYHHQRAASCIVIIENLHVTSLLRSMSADSRIESPPWTQPPSTVDRVTAASASAITAHGLPQSGQNMVAQVTRLAEAVGARPSK